MEIDQAGPEGQQPTPETAPKKTVPWGILITAFVGALFGVLVGAMTTTVLIQQAIGLDTLAKADPSTEKELAPLKPSSDLVVNVAKKAGPAVVNIRSQILGTEDFHEGMEMKGQGSGVVFRSDGYIMTNAHVVEDAKDIFVTLSNGKDVKGTLIGVDVDNDIAVIKVSAKGLPAAKFGRSRDLRVGELAVAIGSPFGLEHSVTTGVVSALHRNVSAGDEAKLKTLTNLIQTDAPINPGNSGGALTNYEGKVIGINTLIFTTNGSGQGIGFAIPSEFALSLANQLIKKGKTASPYIGVCVGNVDEVVAKSMKIDVTKGALITKILPKSPAIGSGLETKDVIVKAGSTEVKSAEDLIAAVRGRNVGDKMTVQVIRGAQRRSLTLPLAEKPKQGGSGCTEVIDRPGSGTPDSGRQPPGHP